MFYRRCFSLFAVLLVAFVALAPAADETPKDLTATFKGHKEAVYSIAFSPDNKFLVTASGDPSIKVWAASTGKEIKSFSGSQGHKGLVMAVAVNNDGTLLASGGTDNTARVWDFPSSKYLRELEQDDDSRAVAVSADGLRVAGGNKDGKIRVWTAADGKKVIDLAGHKGAINGLAFSPNGQILVSAGADSRLIFHGIPDGKQLANFAAHSGAVAGVAYAPGNNGVYTIGVDGQLKFWSLPPTAARALGTAFKDEVSTMMMTGDGQTIITGAGKAIRVNTLSNGANVREYATTAKDVTSTGYNGTYLAAGSSDGSVTVWQTKDGGLLSTFNAHKGGVKSVFLSGNSVLATAGADGKVRFFSAPPGKSVRLTHPDIARSASSPDGKRIVTGGADKLVRLWDTKSPNAAQRQFSGHTAAVTAAVLTNDGQIIASAGEDRTIRFFNTKSGQQTALIGAHTGTINSLAFYGNSQVISASADGTVKMWAVPGAPGKNLFAHAGAVTAAVLSPDGNKLLTGCADKQVRLWNLGTGQVERTWSGPTLGIQCVAFSPKGDRVAAGSADKSFVVWEASSTKEVKKFTGLSAAVNALAFAADGQKIAVGLGDGTVDLYELTKGTRTAVKKLDKAISNVLFIEGGKRLLAADTDGEINLLPIDKVAAGSFKHGAALQAVALSVDGKKLAVGGSDKTVKVYTFPAGKLETTLTTPAEVRGLAFAPDGKRIAIAGGDGSARIYATTGEFQEYAPQDGAVNAVAFSADGKKVYTASADKNARVWMPGLIWQAVQKGDVRQAVLNGRADRVYSAGADGVVGVWQASDGKAMGTIKAHKGAVSGLGISSDSSKLLTAGADKTAKMWDLTKVVAGKELDKPLVECTVESVPDSLTLSPDAKRFALGLPGAKAGEERVAIHDAASGKELLQLDGIPTKTLAFQSDNRTLLASGNDKTAQLVDVTVSSILDAHTGGANAVILHGNGTQVLTAGADKNVKLWTIATGKLDRTFGPMAEAVTSLGFSRDNVQIAATAGKTTKVWTLADGKEVATLEHSEAVNSVSFNSDKTRLATAGSDGRARVWDMTTKKELQGFLHAGSVVSVAYHPFTSTQLVTASADKTVQVHTVSATRGVVVESKPSAILHAPTQNQLLVPCADGKLRFFNTNNGNVDKSFEAGTKAATSVGASRNGLLVAVGSSDKKVFVFNYNTPKALATLTAPAAIKSLTFSSNSQTLIGVGNDGSITCWDVTYAQGQLLPSNFGKVLQSYSHGKTAFEVAYPTTATAAVFYTAGEKSIKAWKLPSDAPVRNFSHPASVNSVAFNKDGTRLVTGCGDGRVRIFNLTTGALDKQIIAHNTMNSTAIYCVAYSPDEKFVVSGSMDQSLKLWEVAKGTLVKEFKAYNEKTFPKGHQDSVLTVAFSTDGKQIISGGMDKMIKVWNVSDGSVVRDFINPNLKEKPAVSLPGNVYSLKLLPGGKEVLSVGQAPELKGYIAKWELATGKLVSGKEQAIGTIFGVAVSSDGKHYALCTGGSLRTGDEYNRGLVFKMGK